jgi:hypothetical protein
MPTAARIESLGAGAFTVREDAVDESHLDKLRRQVAYWRKERLRARRVLSHLLSPPTAASIERARNRVSKAVQELTKARLASQIAFRKFVEPSYYDFGNSGTGKPGKSQAKREDRTMDQSTVPATLAGLTVEKITDEYFNSLNGNTKLHIVRTKNTDLGDIEQDARLWYEGFSSCVKMLGSGTNLPPIEGFLAVVTKNFGGKARIAA